MIKWLQKKMQNSNKLLALLLILFCGQLSLAAHSHDETDTSFEACSVCLVGQNAEFDDVLTPDSSANLQLNLNTLYLSEFSSEVIFDNSPFTLYLRGPPA
jgi:hypothetical protein